jgi:hypothetical protein
MKKADAFTHERIPCQSRSRNYGKENTSEDKELNSPKTWDLEP